MLELRTLGGLSVISASPLGRAAAHPRRLALLALLADAAERGMSRDALLGFLWPEQDSGRARRRLTQTLYALRQDLGEDQLISGTSRLQLNRLSIGCDLWDFRQALFERNWAGAVDLYRGPFLAGVFLSKAPEFDRWLEPLRQELFMQFCRALHLLAIDDGARGAHASSVALLQRLSALEPHNASVAAHLARQMSVAGDRAGAVSAIHKFGARLRKDLALPLDIELVSLADDIRAELQPRVLPGDARAVVSPPEAGDESAIGASAPLTEVQAPVGANANASAHVPGSDAPIPRRHERRRVRTFAFAAAALVLVATPAIYAAREPAGQASTSPVLLTVLPFAVYADSAHANVSDGIAGLVAQNLDGAGPLRAAFQRNVALLLQGAASGADTSSALSSRLHLDRYVSGSVTMLGSAVRMYAVLHDASRNGMPLGTATAAGSADSLFQIAESIAQQLLGLDPSFAAGSLARSASGNTTSLPAFRAFMEGEASFRAARFGDAVEAFQRAVHEDTTFALAYYRLADAYDWNAQGSLIRATTEAANRFSYRLAWRERTLLEGATAWRDGQNNEAESRLRLVTSRFPNDVEAWFQLGEVLFHSNAVRGRLFVAARAPLERVLALDPSHRAALTHLARIRSYHGDVRGADSALGAAIALMTEAADPELALFRAAVANDRRGVQLALARLDQEPPSAMNNAVHRLTAYALNPSLADTVLRRAFRFGIAADHARSAHYLAAQNAAAQGQVQRALLELDALASLSTGQALELRALILTTPASRYFQTAREVTRDRVRGDRHHAGANGDVTSDSGLGRFARWYLLGLMAAESRDTLAVAHYADSLARAAPATARANIHLVFAAGLRATRLAMSGQPRAALSELLSAPEVNQGNHEMLVASQLHERLLRASLLEQVGRSAEALDVYGSLIFGDPNSLLLAAPAALRRARLLARLGRSAEASVEYRTFVRIWSQADRELQPVVDSARHEMARLR